MTTGEHSALLTHLRGLLGDDSVMFDGDTLHLMAGDLYSSGPLPLAVIRPDDSASLAQAMIRA